MQEWLVMMDIEPIDGHPSLSVAARAIPHRGRRLRVCQGRLRARKCGKRTIIGDDDGDEWLRNLSLIEEMKRVHVP